MVARDHMIEDALVLFKGDRRCCGPGLETVYMRTDVFRVYESNSMDVIFSNSMPRAKKANAVSICPTPRRAARRVLQRVTNVIAVDHIVLALDEDPGHLGPVNAIVLN